MKKIFIILSISLLPLSSINAQDNIVDLKASYARIGYDTIGSGSGYQFGTAMYYKLYEEEQDFIKGISVGAGIDYSTALAKGVWYYNLLAGPEVKVDMPYSYFKFGFGYNYWKVKGLSSVGAVGVKVSAGTLFDITDTTRLGLDISLAYKVTKGKVTVFSLGPILSSDI